MECVLNFGEWYDLVPQERILCIITTRSVRTIMLCDCAWFISYPLESRLRFSIPIFLEHILVRPSVVALAFAYSVTPRSALTGVLSKMNLCGLGSHHNL
jgi:hypothetical protein